MFQSLKNKAGNFFLRTEISASSRNRRLFNLNESKTIGILFDATDDADFDLVRKYVLYLREMKKRVRAIGFYNEKVLPVNTFSKLEYDFFSRKECNWYGKPSGKMIENFIGEEFDILMDLNIHDHYGLTYMAALSKAQFKVGKFREEGPDIYDMMIEAESDQGLKYFMRQMDTYLLKLNKKESA